MVLVATILKTSDREREQMRRAAIGGPDQGPTDEEQVRRWPYSQLMHDLLDPQDPTNVSFPFLRRMRRHHTIAMGLHFIAMPIVKAPWYYEADDARVAAMADNILRPIYGDLILLIMRFLSFGFSPGVKNFDIVSSPSWVYNDEQGNSQKVWDNGNVDAVIYKPVIPLRPENALPTYKNGKFNGITYDGRYGGIGYFLVNGTRTPEIDLLHSVWAVHDQQNEDGCQPAGEMVLTTQGEVPIEALDPQRHRLVSYDPKNGKILRGLGSRERENDRGFGFKIFTRPHQGDMLTIKVNGKSMRATPNHKLTVRWNENAVGRWCVYVMRRGSDYRIGTTQVLNQKSKQTNSGVGSRMQREGADAGWILKTFDTRREALLHEALWSNQYGVPDMCFKACDYTDNGLRQEEVDRFWQAAGAKAHRGAYQLLADFGRDHKLPMYERTDGERRARQSGLHNKWTINAANLMPGLMLMPTDPGEGMEPDWGEIEVDREPFDGVVYSLQVDPYKHYVSGGVITRNSPFGLARIAHCAPIFHMYRFIWNLLGRAFENNADPGPVVRYPREEADTLDAEGNRIRTVDAALRLGRRRRSGSTIAMPSDTYRDFQDKPTGVKLWDIEYPKADISFEPIQQFLGFLDALMLRGLWLQEQGLIEGTPGSTSNRNVAREFGSQRDASQAVLMQQIDTFIDDVFMRPIMAMNMPTYEGRLVKKTMGFGEEDEDIVRQVFQLMGQSPTGMASFGIDVRRLAEARGFPMLDPAEQKRQLEEAAKIASQSPTPTVTPTQGRRAFVTQTGFGETVYQQLPGRLTLAELATRGVDDGDFVANLPRTDVFDDSGVVDATRDLRSRAVAFLAWAYNDIARHLGKQKSLDLDEELRDSSAEEVAERLVLSWHADLHRIEGLLGGVRGSLGRIFDKAALAQARKLDERGLHLDVGEALDERCLQAVSGALNALREQTTTMIVGQVEKRASYSELAQSVRSLSEGLPAARADALAVTEAEYVHNLAVVEVGRAAGVARAQIIEDGSERHGEIIDLADDVDLNSSQHMSIRLLTRASDDFDVRDEALDGDLLARFDAESNTILLSPEIGAEERSEYLLAAGSRLL